jgi:hypothetical protein
MRKSEKAEDEDFQRARCMTETVKEKLETRFGVMEHESFLKSPLR